MGSSCFGDYIGMESCNDMENDDGEKNGDRSDVGFGYSHRRRLDQRLEMKREFPPPIPSLARTGNLNSHMPWVMKRSYTSDGRLILWEEKVKHHEYFRAHRSNGRLTLHLVPLDDDDLRFCEIDPDGKIESFDEKNGGIDEGDENEYVGREEMDEKMEKFESSDEINDGDKNEEVGKEDDDQKVKVDENGNAGKEKIGEIMEKLESFRSDKDDDKNGNMGKEMVEKLKKIVSSESYQKDNDQGEDKDEKLVKETMKKLVSSVPESSSLSSTMEKGKNGGIGSNGGGGKCLNFNSMSSSFSCIFDMPVTAIRPVHI